MISRNVNPCRYAIICDLDGTVLDSVPVAKKIIAEMCAELGIAFNDIRFQRSFGYPLRDSLKRYFGAQIAQDPSMLDRLEARFKEHAARAQRAPLIFGAEPALQKIRDAGILCGLATNRTAAHLVRDVDAKILNTLFDVVQTHFSLEEDYGVLNHRVRIFGMFRKPDAQALWPILNYFDIRYRVPLSCITFVGDSFADLEAASDLVLNYGMRFVAVLTGAVTDPDIWEGKMHQLHVPKRNRIIIPSLGDLTPEYILKKTKTPR